MRAVGLVALVLAGVALSSCGESSDDNVSGKTTITFWHFQSEPGQKKALEARIAEFEKTNSDIHVELQDLTWKQGREKLMAAFSSGQAPDVVELGSDWVAQYSAAGVLADQGTMKGDSLGRFAAHLTTPGRWKEGVYAWPWTSDTRVLFVNTGLLASAGIDTSATDTLWSDVLVKAERLLKPPSVFGFGANGSDRHRLYKKILPFFWSNGGELLSADGRPVINSPANVAALSIYVDLSRAGFVDNQMGLDQMFVAGKIGYWISGPWLVDRIAKENPGLRYRVELIPGFAGRPAESFAGGEYLAISAQSKSKEAGKRLITFLTSPAQALQFAKDLPGGTTPADLRVASDPFLQSAARRIFTRQLQSARMTPVHPKWLELEEIIEYEIAAAIIGEKTPQEALDAAQVKTMQLLGLAPEEPAS